ncbi:hypothetical protein [Nostoc sp. FACHB-110]|nr:hypothetical protein [Nostoc sp. FACHB-110]MBD2441307.1 hypothetical protein [Nostoc sp. FACHB-110]
MLSPVLPSSSHFIDAGDIRVSQKTVSPAQAGWRVTEFQAMAKKINT